MWINMSLGTLLRDVHLPEGLLGESLVNVLKEKT
jgi:hypothetical protein